MSGDERHSKPQLLSLLLLTKEHCSLATRLADLVGTNPLSFDRPNAVALVIWVIASEVAMLYQTTAGVSALKVNNLELSPNN